MNLATGPLDFKHRQLATCMILNICCQAHRGFVLSQSSQTAQKDSTSLKLVLEPPNATRINGVSLICEG